MDAADAERGKTKKDRRERKIPAIFFKASLFFVLFHLTYGEEDERDQSSFVMFQVG